MPNSIATAISCRGRRSREERLLFDIAVVLLSGDKLISSIKSLRVVVDVTCSDTPKEVMVL